MVVVAKQQLDQAQVSEQLPVCSEPARSATEAVAMKLMSKGEARWQGQSSCKHRVPLVVLSTEPGSLSLSLSVSLSLSLAIRA